MFFFFFCSSLGGKEGANIEEEYFFDKGDVVEILTLASLSDVVVMEASPTKEAKLSGAEYPSEEMKGQILPYLKF